MNKVKIFSDSTCDLSPELLQQHDISLVPLKVVFGEESYDDGVNLSVPELYAKVDETGKLPKTGSPSPIAFAEAFRPYIEAEYQIIYIGLSSELSSTIQNARIAASEFPEERIEVVDSQNLSTGIGILVMKAVDLAQEGLGVKEIAAQIRTMVPKVETEFIIDTLDYLHKGGRCSSVQNFIGSMLKIRPVVKVVDGKMILADKVRGKRQRALATMLNNALGNKDKMSTERIFVTHSLSDEDALYLKAELEKQTDVNQVLITSAGCVISSHCGPNTVGIIYSLK